MGEGYGRWSLGADAELVAEVSSANVACGFHAGDPRTMDATVALAAAAGVAIGAHVSYPDLPGFGRRHLDVTADELIADVLVQIGALHALCVRHGASVGHVKAHGALYHDLSAEPGLCDAFAEAVEAWPDPLPVLMLAGSRGAGRLRARGVRVVPEAFADRGYAADGGLVPRTEPGAMLDDPVGVAERAVRIARGEPVETVDGSPVTIEAASLCVHGDTPGAARIARAVGEALRAAGIAVAPPV